MTFESKGLLTVAFYIWLPPGRYIVFLTTLIAEGNNSGKVDDSRFALQEEDVRKPILYFKMRVGDCDFFRNRT